MNNTRRGEGMSPVSPVRVAPALTSVSEAFWKGGAAGELLVNRCGSCGRWSHPPRERCRWCHAKDVLPTPLSGRGTVASFTINHQQWGAEPADPYVVALVELEEQDGLRLLTNIVGPSAADVRIGDPVRVTFLPFEDVWLPLFVLDRTPSTPPKV